MPFTNDTFSRASFKKLVGLAHTSNDKDPANEVESSQISISYQEIFGSDIPTNPSAAISSGVAKFASLNLSLDPSSNGKSYTASVANAALYDLDGYINPRTGLNYSNGDRVGFLIPPQFGTEYRAILLNGAVEVPPLASEDWFIDYRSGIVTSEDDLNLGIDGYLDAYVYVGDLISDRIDSINSNLSSLQSQIDGIDDVWGQLFGDIYNTNSDNVGIGTFFPEVDLHVVGSTTLGSIMISPDNSVNEDSELILTEDDDGTFGIKLRYYGVENELAVTGFNGGYNSTQLQRSLRISRDGYVGVGPDVDFEELLEIHLDQNTTTTILVQNDNSTGVNAEAAFAAFSGGSYAQLSYRPSQHSSIVQEAGLLTTNGTGGLFINVDQSAPIVFSTVSLNNERVRIDGSGNVGINVSDPEGLLHIGSKLTNAHYDSFTETYLENTESTLQLIADDGGTATSVIGLSAIEDASTNHHWVFNHKGVLDDHRLDISYFTSASSGNILRTTGSEKLSITTDGYVGVNATDPSATFEVQSLGDETAIFRSSALNEKAIVRIVEGPSFLGSFIKYEGATNDLEIGTHNTANTDVNDDITYWRMRRTDGVIENNQTAVAWGTVSVNGASAASLDESHGIASVSVSTTDLTITLDDVLATSTYTVLVSADEQVINFGNKDEVYVASRTTSSFVLNTSTDGGSPANWSTAIGKVFVAVFAEVVT